MLVRTFLVAPSSQSYCFKSISFYRRPYTLWCTLWSLRIAYINSGRSYHGADIMYVADIRCVLGMAEIIVYYNFMVLDIWKYIATLDTFGEYFSSHLVGV